MPGSTADATQSFETTPKFAVRRVGVVGLGHMGHTFATNLVADGYQVFVYDRDPTRSATLSRACPAGRLADLASCDVVVTSLPDDDALAAVAPRPCRFRTLCSPNPAHP